MIDHSPRRPATLAWLFVAWLIAGGAAGQAAPQANRAAEDFALAGTAPALPPAAAAGVAAIRAEALAAHIRFLASPALAGRGLGTPGLDAAAEYAAAGLALAGIAPLPAGEAAGGAPAVYFQPVPLREISAFGGALTLEQRQGDARRSRSFLAGKDCLLPEMAPQVISAPLVFAGYGIREDTLGRDDYRGLDVRGKAVIILGGVPAGAPWQAPEIRKRWLGEPAEPSYRAKLEAARSHGAVAVLVVEADDWPARLAEKDAVVEHFFQNAEPGTEDDGPPLVRVSGAAGEFLGLGEHTANGALAGVSATIEAHGDERLPVSRNVIGWIPGRDDGLRSEAVVIGAHIDHLGVVGGAIHPGADDNASGSAALLEIARVFATASQRPRRSLVFVFWTGEEEGHLGSQHYVRHPRWPLAHTTAYLNLDMIGHPWLDKEIRELVSSAHLENGEQLLAKVKTEDFAEPGVADWSPELAEVLRRAGPAVGLTIHLDRTDGLHGGSDYRSFARAHIPFVRFFGNFFPDYHEPGDTADRLDPAQVQRVARFCLATAWLLADR
jgi:hypothetical protein